MAGHILVVDGIATNRITTKVRLTASCYSVSVAATGADAVRAVHACLPQMVLIGPELPDTGIDRLCAALRAMPGGRDLPILVQARPHDRVPVLRAGASALLDPDGDDLTLMARVRSFIRDDAEPERRGLSEDPAAFLRDPRPRAVFIADQRAAAMSWRHSLQDHTDLMIRVSDPERALSEAASGDVPDLYVIACDIRQPGDGLRLLSELRSRWGSRHAAFVAVLRPERSDMTPIALDLGAGDVLTWDFPADEAAMRLEAQLVRKKNEDNKRQLARQSMLWAMTDPLTGLYNRRFAIPRLTEAMSHARSEGSDLAVMLMDLDRFKLVNDMHGHAAGDAVLVEISSRLSELVPPRATLARIGGEEFLLSVPDCTAPQARRIAEALRRHVAAAPVQLPAGSGAPELSITISVGVALFSCDDAPMDAGTIVSSADRALMNAKALGRNRIVMAPEAMAA